MRLVNFVFIGVCFSFAAHASENRTETCKGVSGIAMKIMAARQGGVPVSDLLSELEKAGDDQWIFELVKLAYSEPRFSTEENKQKSVTEFGNQTFISCID